MQSNEILAVVDSVSTEKGLEKDVIFKAIEIAIASASQRHFHEDADLFVKMIEPQENIQHIGIGSFLMRIMKNSTQKHISQLVTLILH